MGNLSCVVKAHFAVWSVLHRISRPNSQNALGDLQRPCGTEIKWTEVELAMQTLFPERLPTGEGILPSQEILHFAQTGIIRSARDIDESQIQPASIDLRLSREAYRVRASFLPGRSTTLLTKATDKGLLDAKLDLSAPTLLERGVIYVIPLMESLELPADVYGFANPKSTTGRLDIFTRLITEHGDEFERVRRGYRGQLYIEVISQSFPIVVQAGMTLNQLRFGRGKFVVAGDAKLKLLDQDALLVDADDNSGRFDIDRGLRVTVDLSGNGSGIVGYQASRCTSPIDLGLIDHYDVADFWRPIPVNEKHQYVLEPGEFYILASKQRVRVPADLAAEMLPYDLATQEFRVHYAGFFDPGFGFGRDGEIPGTKAVLEVRANEMPILLEDDQFVGRFNYYSMSAKPSKVYGEKIGSNYQQQGLALAKQFRRDQQAGSAPSVNVAGIMEARSHDGGRNAQFKDLDDDDEGMLLRAGYQTNSGEQAVSAKGFES
jgi:dCTP deaminase